MRQEHARLGALDDPVVVGRGDGDDRSHADRSERTGIGGLELGRHADAADPDDDALARHQPRHGLNRPERAGVGERHGHAGEVVRADLAGVDLAHELLVGEHEGPEVETLGLADHRDQEGARPVGPRDVDCQTETDVLVTEHPRDVPCRRRRRRRRS